MEGVDVGTGEDAGVGEDIDGGVEVGTGVSVGGTGVKVGGRGGGVNTGKAPVLPVTVANWPHSQQDWPGAFGFWIIQYVLFAFRPTTCATWPTSRPPTLG